ncbi:hypothetical protein CLTEP_14640 [Clostridium tepidiprofundi DSM 19306]|uniref:OmpA-like domain-containing protein n=1 Tax=Clostridium tepidiprofundi DSM 19306 TaxID=1121338 RepID=A0A151B420_9CLOT|nr:OmpA family protein [Clostridium tepidiprofundi]KYH34636.1 hypothetical protein CLTEP_14640 [Clostridium tepidiprofundi DSM 19306]
MKARKRYFSEESSENFWPSFTDMISTIVLILFFLILLSYVQNIIVGSNLQNANKELELANSKIVSAKKRLRRIQSDVERAEMALQLSQDKIDKQEKVILESNKELGDLRAKLRSVGLIRVNVLKQVQESIENELGNNINKKKLVSVAENGNIILNESILFDTGSAVIKENSKELLNKLATSFEKILDDEQVRKYIDAIEIQGHADERKGNIPNSVLSANRATAVVDYLMKANPNLKAKYGKYFAASGYSYFRPRVKGSNPEAWRANRRIEISVILKDPSIRKLIDEYLNESDEMFTDKQQ